MEPIKPFSCSCVSNCVRKKAKIWALRSRRKDITPIAKGMAVSCRAVARGRVMSYCSVSYRIALYRMACMWCACVVWCDVVPHGVVCMYGMAWHCMALSCTSCYIYYWLYRRNTMHLIGGRSNSRVYYTIITTGSIVVHIMLCVLLALSS